MAENLADAVLKLRRHQHLGDFFADVAAFLAQQVGRLFEVVGCGVKLCQHAGAGRTVSLIRHRWLSANKSKKRRALRYSRVVRHRRRFSRHPYPDKKRLHPMSEKYDILIVDDNPQNLKVLGAILIEAGYGIHIAQSGEQALKAAETMRPDLILLDIMMPGMDGYEVCRRLKADALTEHVPVIFLTAKIEEEDVVQGLELGAVDYVTKPFNAAILLARVKTHVRLGVHQRLLFEQSNIDALTLLPNRRRFDSVLAAAWRKALHGELPLALVLLDVDYFDSFKDVLGSSEGDDLIRWLAALLDEAVLVSPHFLAHYGGKEFAILLADTGLQAAVEFAETLRLSVLDAEVAHPASPLGAYVTISLGVASLQAQAALDASDLVKAADQQLILAKQHGRNRVYPSP
ncbi:MAG: diguanylate cyclase [Methylococcaceae bacterium]|nr:MAG: diguanylate cyclase [Methylococcaceae bacterium]